MTAPRIAASLLALLALGGCSALQSAKKIDNDADTAHKSGSVSVNTFKRLAADQARTFDQIVDKPWIAGRPQPLAREVTLPPALRANVNTTLLFEEREIGLVTLAERIKAATGIPTHVEPDALLPREAFLPRLALAQVPTGGVPSTVDTLVPALGAANATVQLSGPALPKGVSRTKVGALAPGQAPLASVLDAASLRLGVYWRYDPQAGAIRFYRTETRTFSVRALGLEAESSIELGLTGGGSNQSAGSQFASQSRSKFSASGQAKPLDAIVIKLEQYLTRAGVVKAMDGAANTVVITDTKDALDRVATFIDAENRLMTRRVRLVFEEVTIQRDHLTQAGVDWKVLFNSLGRANTAAGAGVGTLLDGAKAAANVSATVGSGPFAGSGLVLSALSELGTVVRHTSIPMLAMNRRPATYTTRESFDYVKDLQQTQSTSDSSAPTVTATQDEKTIGTFLTVIPDAQEDGQVLLAIAYDDTRLIGPLKKETFGSPDSPSFVQQARIGGQGVVQQVELRPGQPVVIGGYEQSAGSATRRRLDDRAPMVLGGSDAAQEQQLLTVLLVTAIPEEGF